MRVAALYDIHGNVPALDAVLTDVRHAGADLVVIGGDVLPGPMPRETFVCLAGSGLPTQYIRGNGDREVLGQMRGVETSLPEPFAAVVRWDAAQLDESHARLMDAWPLALRLSIPPLGDVLFCHATPRNDMDIFTRNTPDAALLPIFKDVGAAVVVCGHTHMQFDRTVGGVRVVNAGSVGMPFGEPGAYWLMFGSEIELRRTTYDLAGAAERIRGSAYPQAHQFADENILNPPSEAMILERFAYAEVK